MSFEMEEISCPLCGSEESADLVKREDGLQIVGCSGCGLKYLNPRPVPEQISRLYSADYYGSTTEGQQWDSSQYDPSKSVAEPIPPFGWEFLVDNVALREKRTLDVGCAYGRAVLWMRRAGAQAVGCDLSAEAVRWGRKHLKLDLREATIETLEEPPSSFDVITAWHVIEHLTDLHSFMRRVGELLKPGGVVFVATPNFGPYYAHREKWAYRRFSLEHLLFFERDTLNSLFEQHNFEPLLPASVLHELPGNSAEYAKVVFRKASSTRSRIMQFPGMARVRRIVWRLRGTRRQYCIDESGREGSTIIGLYRKSELSP